MEHYGTSPWWLPSSTRASCWRMRDPWRTWTSCRTSRPWRHASTRFSHRRMRDPSSTCTGCRISRPWLHSSTRSCRPRMWVCWTMGSSWTRRRQKSRTTWPRLRDPWRASTRCRTSRPWLHSSTGSCRPRMWDCWMMGPGWRRRRQQSRTTWPRLGVSDLSKWATHAQFWEFAVHFLKQLTYTRYV